MSARALAAALLLLAGLAGCREGAGSPPLPTPEAHADRPSFDGAAAFALLERQVAFGPRVPGTPGHARQLDWMTRYLRERADTVEVQRFTHRTTRGERLELANVIARFAPDSGERLLLLAHWDTRPTADRERDPARRRLPVPGANDGASGVAVLLQLADMLARAPAPIGVDILLTDGEDYGPGPRDMLLGARHFAAHLPAGYAPRYGILLDMVGGRDPRFLVEEHSARLAPAVVRRVWGVARELGFADVFPLRIGPTVDDDHLPLNAAGIPTINVIDFEYGPGNRFWHTLDDVPENTSAETLRMVGEVIAEVVYRGG
jgi:glutaminyl-peptide cyclotransferase